MVIVIIETFPLVESSTPLRYHEIVIGRVPLSIVQLMITLDPVTAYTRVPIVTFCVSFATAKVGSDVSSVPFIILGGSPNEIKLILLACLENLSNLFW